MTPEQLLMIDELIELFEEKGVGVATGFLPVFYRFHSCERTNAKLSEMIDSIPRGKRGWVVTKIQITMCKLLIGKEYAIIYYSDSKEFTGRPKR